MMFAPLALVLVPQTISIRVDGRGYLRLDHKGQVAYTPQATLTARSGSLVTTDGDQLVPEISVPQGAGTLTVSLDGTVRLGSKELGRLVLAHLPGEAKRTSLFSSSVRAQIGNPGEYLFGVIRSGGPKAPTSSSTSAPTAPPIQPEQATGKATVVVHQTTELTGQTYTFGDIADIDGPEAIVNKIKAIPLGTSPLSGLDQKISQAYLMAKIRSVGVSAAQFSIEVPDGARVASKSQTIEADAFIQAALKGLQAEFEILTPLVPSRNVQKAVIAPGDYTLKTDIDPRGTNSVDVKVSVLVDGKTVTSRVITFTPEAGTAQIRVGETVTVRVVQAGAAIELIGKATSSGFAGQNISVQTTGPNASILTGVVKKAGLVEVRL